MKVAASRRVVSRASITPQLRQERQALNQNLRRGQRGEAIGRVLRPETFVSAAWGSKSGGRPASCEPQQSPKPPSRVLT